MRFLVIGLGSMGKRRIRLLRSYFPKIDVVGVDLTEERRKNAKEEFLIDVYSSIDEANSAKELSGVIICTSPLTHSKIILECIEKNLNVFTEINLVDDNYDEIISEANKKGVELFLSSTMLYRKEIEYIGERVKSAKNKVNYTYHVGQYLPDWHPWENYKNFFVNEKRSNGCRELFAIELPWLYKVFGKIKDVKVNKAKISTLDINYDDTYQVMIVHENGTFGILNIDIVSRKPIRSFEVYGEDIHIFWKGTPDSLIDYDFESKKEEKIETYTSIDKNSNYSENIIENAYIDELKTYIDKINSINNEKYTFEDDKYVLSIIDEIEGN